MRLFSSLSCFRFIPSHLGQYLTSVSKSWQKQLYWIYSIWSALLKDISSGKCVLEWDLKTGSGNIRLDRYLWVVWVALARHHLNKKLLPAVPLSPGVATAVRSTCLIWQNFTRERPSWCNSKRDFWIKPVNHWPSESINH